MLHQVQSAQPHSLLRQRLSRWGLATFTALSFIGASQITTAGPTVDQLSECLVKSTTATDKTAVLQWTFVALSTHPDLKTFSNVTAEQKTALDQKFAQVVQRILVEQCAEQAKAVIKTEGISAVGDSFQALGRNTGDEILKNQEVKAQLKGVLKYVDMGKLVSTFLTPDIFSKLGLAK
ncbi:type 1 glutamine amidotransferase family protein [Acinetobacter lanii]|uniref:hypothetical protein n=1 Tax=Acinetobacter lanii TaxID=2715163 RepID=UPI00148F798D|nr:hypothetical protein [Acinetobacter lanii]